MKIKIKDIVQMASALLAITYHEGCTYGEDEAIEIADKIINVTSNEYERGWQEALDCAIEASDPNVDGYLAKKRYISAETLKAMKLAHNEASMNLEREVEI